VSMGASLLLFFAATFAIAWSCFIAVAVAHPPSTLWGQVLLYVGTFSPSYVALAVTYGTQGRRGARALFARVFQGNAAARWYVFAIGYFAAIKLSAALIQRVLTGQWPRFGTEPLYLIPFAIAISTPVQAGEEIGWRGFALPRLATRLGLGPASVVLGGLWAVWHLPLFFVREADTFGQSFPMYALSVVAISVAMAMLYAKSDGGLLLPMLFHAAVNNTKDIVPSGTPGATNPFAVQASPVGWTAVALIWAFGIVMLAWMGRTESTRAGRYAAWKGVSGDATPPNPGLRSGGT
jgi:uncharacterized protein